MSIPKSRTPASPPFTGASAKPSKAEAMLVMLDTVEPKSVRWLWIGYVPKAMLTIIEGDPGNGKSTVTLDLAARVSAGVAMPDGSQPDTDGKTGIVILSAEDDPACTIRPRLDAAGAHCNRIAMLDGVRGDDGERMPNVTDLDAIRAAVESVDAAMVIVDPITAYMGPKADTHRDADVRARLAPLAKLAAELGFALVIVRHLKKSSGETNATYRGGGSIGFIGAARACMLVGRDPEDEEGERRILAPHKSNVAKLAPSMAFHIESIDVPGVGTVPAIKWEGTSLTGAGELLRAQARATDDDEPSRLEEAKAFLNAMLSDGPVPTTTALREAKGQGISEKTLRRAQAALAVVAERDGKRWAWRLPDSEPTPDQQGDAWEPPASVNEAGQPKMANGDSDDWPPSNSLEPQDNGCPTAEGGHTSDAGHLGDGHAARANVCAHAFPPSDGALPEPEVKW